MCFRTFLPNRLCGLVTLRVHMLSCFDLNNCRSVTRSYFRRADGVMLLYDITSEKSFLSVREWIDAVDVSEMRNKKVEL